METRIRARGVDLTGPTPPIKQCAGVWRASAKDQRSHQGLRRLDRSSAGAIVEYRLANSTLQMTYVGEPGWHQIPVPTPGLELKAKFHQKLASIPWGPLFRAGLETANQDIRRIRHAAQMQGTLMDDRARIFAPATIGPQSRRLWLSMWSKNTNQLSGFVNCTGDTAMLRLSQLSAVKSSLFDPLFDVSRAQCPLIIKDTVDGTDDVEQGTSDWCSSMVFFNPPENRILAAIVGLADGMIYFAIEGLVGKCLYHDLTGPFSPDVFPLGGPSGVTSLGESLVAFYGQKPSRLAVLCKDREYNALLASMRVSKRARIRTQGGQPMMMRLADHLGHRQVDAVFEKLGQAPHDVVAGLHIAQMAGASLCDLRGSPLDLCAAIRRPADPASRLKYVLAASPELAGEICCRLGEAGSKRQFFLRCVARFGERVSSCVPPPNKSE